MHLVITVTSGALRNANSPLYCKLCFLRQTGIVAYIGSSVDFMICLNTLSNARQAPLYSPFCCILLLSIASALEQARRWREHERRKQASIIMLPSSPSSDPRILFAALLGFITFVWRLMCKGPHFLHWVCVLPWKLFKGCYYFLCMRSLPGYHTELSAAQAEYSRNLADMQRKHGFKTTMARNIYYKQLAARDAKLAALRSKEQMAQSRLDRVQQTLDNSADTHQRQLNSNNRHYNRLLQNQARHQAVLEAQKSAAEALLSATQQQCANQVLNSQQECAATVAALNAQLDDTQQQLMWSAWRHQAATLRHQRRIASYDALRDGFAIIFAAWYMQQNALVGVQQQQNGVTGAEIPLQQQNIDLQTQLAHVSQQLRMTEEAYTQLQQQASQQVANVQLQQQQQQTYWQALLQQQADHRLAAVQQQANAAFTNLQQQANIALRDAEQRSDNAQQQANIAVYTAQQELTNAVAAARQEATDAVAAVRQQAVAVLEMYHHVHYADPQVTTYFALVPCAYHNLTALHIAAAIWFSHKLFNVAGTFLQAVALKGNVRNFYVDLQAYHLESVLHSMQVGPVMLHAQRFMSMCRVHQAGYQHSMYDCAE